MILAFMVFSLFFSSAQAGEKPKLPFHSPEEISFESKQKDLFSAQAKSMDFIGILTRANAPGRIEKYVDVYGFSKQKTLKLNLHECQQLAEKIFGRFDQIALKLTDIELKDSPSKGKICHFGLKDPDPKAQIKEKHLAIFILKLRTFGLVFRYSERPSSAQLKELIQFVENLR